jgi:hypothetical protein
VCTPTFETVPPPLVIVKPTPPAVEHIEDITTTDTDGHWADLLLFLAGAAFLVFIAHKLHQHRLANGTPVDDSDDNNSPTPADSTPIATDSTAAPVTPTESDKSDLWFVYLAVFMVLSIV